MAVSWSTSHKLTYGAIIFLAIAGIITYIFFTKIYRPPSCTDGILNQRELGVDCGGPCSKLCASSFVPLQVLWARGDMVAPGYYNLGAYIVNKNTQGAAYVAYTMTVYDDKGVTLGNRKGNILVVPRRNALIFQPAFNIGQKKLGRISVTIDSITWKRALDTGIDLEIVNTAFSQDSIQGSRVDTLITNPTVTPVPGLTVYAIVYDAEGTTLGFSETRLDKVQARSSERVSFTWPYAPKTAVATIEIIPIAPPRILE